MAVGPLNTSYPLGAPGTGWREIDLKNKIQAINWRRTPLMAMTGETTAKDTKHEWQVRGIDAASVVAHLEGDDFTYKNVAQPTRVSNTCHIIEDGVEVTGTAQALSYYGAGNLMRDQINHQMVNHRRKLEVTFLRSVETTGATNAARRMDGLIAAASTNATSQGGTTLNEDRYVELMNLLDAAGESPNTVIFSAGLAKVVNAFDANGETKWIPLQMRQVINDVMLYHSTFGSVHNFTHRDLSNGSTFGQLVMFEKAQIKRAYLRPTHLIPVAKTVDGDRKVILSEATLEYGNEAAIGYYSNLLVPTV